MPARLILKVPLWTAMLGTVSNEGDADPKDAMVLEPWWQSLRRNGQAWNVLNAALWSPREVQGRNRLMGLSLVSGWCQAGGLDP